MAGPLVSSSISVIESRLSCVNLSEVREINSL